MDICYRKSAVRGQAGTDQRAEGTSDPQRGVVESRHERGNMAMIERTQDEWHALVARLRALPRETEWVEFKVNNKDPESVGCS